MFTNGSGVVSPSDSTLYPSQGLSMATEKQLNFRKIAAIKVEDVLRPIESRTERKLAIKSVSDFLPEGSDEKQSALQKCPYLHRVI